MFYAVMPCLEQHHGWHEQSRTVPASPVGWDFLVFGRVALRVEYCGECRATIEASLFEWLRKRPKQDMSPLQRKQSQTMQMLNSSLKMLGLYPCTVTSE